MKNMLIMLFLLTGIIHAKAQNSPLKIGIAGLTHTHVHWLLGREDIGDVEIVGIAEPNEDLARRYLAQHGLSMKLWFANLDEMIEATQPQAITAFGTIYEHLEVVQKAAPKGIHVMVEKPLAVSMEHAREMKRLADQHQIHLLTNYETTWYASNHLAEEFIKKDSLGVLRKVVVHDGHRGPKEIGVNEEFLEWLIDPKYNGAGALTDFGCYGANLITWLQKNQRPSTVTAITQTLKPDLYPLVDDEATILLTYSNMQGIIQASWNWPISRKDMEVYGQVGALVAEDRSNVTYQLEDDLPKKKLQLSERPYPYNDPFAYMAAVINETIKIAPSDLSALENNMIVMEILTAAMKSAETGQTIQLAD